MITHQRRVVTETRGIATYSCQTTLNARLRFRDETRPSDRNAVDSRTYSTKENNNLSSYLAKNEGLEKSGEDTFRDKERKVVIKPLILIGQGVNVHVTAQRELKLDEMLDLYALNHFILTGKDDYREQQEARKQVQEQPQEQQA